MILSWETIRENREYRASQCGMEFWISKEPSSTWVLMVKHPWDSEWSCLGGSDRINGDNVLAQIASDHYNRWQNSEKGGQYLLKFLHERFREMKNE